MLDMLPTERIGRATWLLAQGRTMTVREVAQTLEITPHGAYQMLERLSRWPIGRRWRRVAWPAGEDNERWLKWRTGRRRPAAMGD